jgi:hypothetical protein
MDEIEAEAAMEGSDQPEWWRDHRNIAAVAIDMVAHGDDEGDLIDLIEKPWKWEDTWVRVKAERAGEAAAIRDARELRELREAGARWSDTET